MREIKDHGSKLIDTSPVKMEGEVAGVWFHIAAGRVLYFVVELKNEGVDRNVFFSHQMGSWTTKI